MAHLFAAPQFGRARQGFGPVASYSQAILKLIPKRCVGSDIHQVAKNISRNAVAAQMHLSQLGVRFGVE